MKGNKQKGNKLQLKKIQFKNQNDEVFSPMLPAEHGPTTTRDMFTSTHSQR